MSLLSIDEMIARGMGRAVTVGALSTGIVGGGAGTILDQDQPELAIGVPAGHVIRPFYAAVQVQPGAATTDADETEILIAVDSLGLWTGDGTVTNENPSNLRSDLDKGSACRVGSAFTGNMTTTPGNGAAAAAPVLDLELIREVLTLELATAAGQNLYLVRVVYQPKYPVFIVGPATLLVYWGGTVANVGGFAQVHWVEGSIDQMLPPI